jgi:hypothetical protein
MGVALTDSSKHRECAEYICTQVTRSKPDLRRLVMIQILLQGLKVCVNQHHRRN